MADDTEGPRLQVACTKEQAEILAEASKAAGYTHAKGGRSAWMLASTLAAAAIALGGAAIQIAGELAREIRDDAEAEAEGLTVEAWLTRALMLTRTARKGEAAPPARGLRDRVRST